MLHFFKNLQRAFFYDEDQLMHHSEKQVIATKKDLENRDFGISKITHFLYTYYYNEMPVESPMSTLYNDSAFNRDLATIYPEKKQLSKQWEVLEIDQEYPEKLYVKRHGISLYVDRFIHLPTEEQTRVLKPGDMTDILFSCHYPNISNGFYVYTGEQERAYDHTGTFRVYFNLKFDYAIAFISALLKLLYENQILFEFKVSKQLREQSRIDNAVLYGNKKCFKSILQLLKPLIADKNHFLNPKTSVFHYSYYPGVGIAEEPDVEHNRKESYGTNRCRLLAEGIYDSLDVLKVTEKIPLEGLLKSYKTHGIDINKIYANKNSQLLEP